MSATQGLPLSGLRVLDLSTEIAGPYATKLLADAGADVIKLEPPGGDPLRRWSASHTPIAEGETGALFQFLNTSKRSAIAELAREAGQELFLELAGTADLVIESLDAGELDALGLGWGTLHARNPGLSLVSISPWGGTGPFAKRPATEWTLQAASGSTAYRGLPERGPVGAGGRLGEWCASIYAATGALAAFLSARRTGEGQHVDLSIFETLLHTLTIYHASIQARFHPGPLAQTLETPSIEPAKDGWVGFCTYTGQQWKDFCLLIGRPELAEGERYFDQMQRMKELPFIQQAIHSWTREHSIDEIIELATQLRLPCVPIGEGKTVLEMDHLRERGVFVQNPAGFTQPRVPYLLQHTKPRPFEPAPELGEHQAEIEAERSRARPSLGEPEGGSPLPLEGLRVVDLTAFWAGPSATSFLAQLGADVIKVESIQRPDGMRFSATVPGEESYEWGPVFHGANPGKRGLTLDLSRERGIAVLRQLVEGADALTENYSARVMDQFGLTWETLHEWNPRLVVVRMPAFGLDGPWRDRTGFAPSVEQVSGLAWMTGFDDLPLIVRGACDPVGGLHASFALLLALEERRKTGRGQLVEVPLVEPALNLAAEQVVEYTAYGKRLSRSGNRGPYAAPQGVYRASDDEYLALAVASDAQWRALAEVLGPPAWCQDPELATAAGRRSAHDAIDDELSKWVAGLPCAEAVQRLIEAGVPASACANAQLIRPHPQLEHRRFFQTLEHPVAGRLDYPVLPMRFSGLGPELHVRPPPTLGEHNEEVLHGELGLGEEELAELRAQKIIGTRPAFL